MDINTTIKHTVEQLFAAAEQENPNGYNLINLVGEVRFNGITYQIQVSLVADKKCWTSENDIMFSEVVKIHV